MIIESLLNHTDMAVGQEPLYPLFGSQSDDQLLSVRWDVNAWQAGMVA